MMNMKCLFLIIALCGADNASASIGPVLEQLAVQGVSGRSNFSGFPHGGNTEDEFFADNESGDDNPAPGFKRKRPTSGSCATATASRAGDPDLLSNADSSSDESEATHL